MRKPPPYGLIAGFDNADDLIAAARRAREAGYRRMDAFTPYPIEELREAMGLRPSPLPLIIFIGGMVGGVGGFLLQHYSAVIAFPLNVGGRPLNSWPAFIPVTFELTILAAALAAVLGMLGLNGLPMPHHPVFNVESFSLATRDRFFLCIEATDPQFDDTATRQFLVGLGSREVTAVAH